MIPPLTPTEPPHPEDGARPIPTLLPWAIKVSLILTVIGVATSVFLSQTLPGSRMTSAARDWRMAWAVGDPETTGSIAGRRLSPGDVRLDPCTAGAEFRLR